MLFFRNFGFSCGFHLESVNLGAAEPYIWISRLAEVKPRYCLCCWWFTFTDWNVFMTKIVLVRHIYFSKKDHNDNSLKIIFFVRMQTLAPSLQMLLKSSLPLQEAFELPIVWLRKQHDLARLLPRPLFVLFLQAKAYQEACGKNHRILLSLANLNIICFLW